MPADTPQPIDGYAAYVLAGGRATRMGGRNKALIEIDGRPLIERLLAVLAPRMPVTILSARGGDFAPYGVPVIADRTPELGPLGGIETGLAGAIAEYNLFVPCDMPGITWALLAPLVDGARGHDFTLYRHVRYEPLVAVYRRSCLPAVRALLAEGERKPILLRDRVDTHVLAIEGGAAFANLNSEQDVAAFGRSN